MLFQANGQLAIRRPLSIIKVLLLLSSSFDVILIQGPPGSAPDRPVTVSSPLRITLRTDTHLSENRGLMVIGKIRSSGRKMRQFERTYVRSTPHQSVVVAVAVPGLKLMDVLTARPAEDRTELLSRGGRRNSPREIGRGINSCCDRRFPRSSLPIHPYRVPFVFVEA